MTPRRPASRSPWSFDARSTPPAMTIPASTLAASRPIEVGTRSARAIARSGARPHRRAPTRARSRSAPGDVATDSRPADPLAHRRRPPASRRPCAGTRADVGSIGHRPQRASRPVSRRPRTPARSAPGHRRRRPAGAAQRPPGDRCDDRLEVRGPPSLRAVQVDQVDDRRARATNERAMRSGRSVGNPVPEARRPEHEARAAAPGGRCWG